MPIRIKQNKIKNDEKALLNLMAGLKKSKTCHFLFSRTLKTPSKEFRIYKNRF
jgi:hypothetical protein